MNGAPVEPRPASHGRGIALVGYRASGKTVVGRILAERLGRPFIDADRLLEARLERTIRQVFAERGEEWFRDAEEALLREICGMSGAVLATGGGAVLRPANRALLKSFGLVVWLAADPAELRARLRE